MSNTFKDTCIKNHTYYFPDDTVKYIHIYIINISNYHIYIYIYTYRYISYIKHFDPNKIKTDENSYKNILIYFIG